MLKKKSGKGLFANLSTDQKYTISVLWKYFRPYLFCLILLFMVIFLAPKVAGDKSSEVKRQEDEIFRMKDELDAAKNQVKLMTDNISDEDKTGIYIGRDNDAQWSADDEAASAFFSKISTWSDGDYYESLRSDFKAMGYEEGDSLMVCFLPPQKTTYDVKEDSDTYGQRILEIDEEGKKQRFEGLTSYRTESSGGISKYVGLVRMSSQDTTGFGSISEAFAYVKYSVSKDGTLSDVEAYALEN